jgi:hypothetical protein
MIIIGLLISRGYDFRIAVAVLNDAPTIRGRVVPKKEAPNRIRFGTPWHSDRLY